MAEKITSATLNEFLSRKPFSIIHFDADWDGYKNAVFKKIDILQSIFNEDVSFGFVDCDKDQELAKTTQILNVPCIAYYRGANLVATVIGMMQDISGNIEKIKRGEIPESSNMISRK